MRSDLYWEERALQREEYARRASMRDIKTKTVKLKTSRCKPCTQTISMSKEAYQYMMSTPVGDMSANHWKRMSENQRIAEHLKETQHDLGAISFEFTIFND